MDFGLSEEISEDVVGKAPIITKISLGLEGYFRSKHYGNGAISFTIGIVCVAPEFEFFFKKNRRKYTKSKRMIEYDIKLDHSVFKAANERQIQKLVAKEVTSSLNIINELKIKDFDIEKFKSDLILFFKKELEIDLNKIE